MTDDIKLRRFDLYLSFAATPIGVMSSLQSYSAISETRTDFSMLNYLCVAIGGALGSVARYWLNGAVTSWGGGAFPLGTLVVNVSGSLAIGFFAALTGPDGRWPAGSAFRSFVMIGICGGYTTFSAFSLQTLDLMKERHWLYASWNVLGSVALCLAGVWLGTILAGSLSQKQ